MRTHWLPLLLLLAAPLHAAADSVLIPLHHLSVAEVEQQLLRVEGRTPAPGGLGAPAEPGLIPAGITAWTANERRNAFEVSGSDQAIQSFRNIVKLLDVPARQVRLSVRVLPLTAGSLRGLSVTPLPQGPSGRQPSDSAAVPTADQLAVLEREGAQSAFELDVTSNHPLHLRWGQSPGQPAVPTKVLPRVNGDGSVTVMIGRHGPGALVQSDEIVLRRITPGQGMVVMSPELGTALLVEVREVLPAAAP